MGKYFTPVKKSRSSKKQVSASELGLKQNVVDYSELDTTLGMRVNSTLKKDFSKLCVKNHTTISIQLKRFMQLAVDTNSLSPNDWSDFECWSQFNE